MAMTSAISGNSLAAQLSDLKNLNGASAGLDKNALKNQVEALKSAGEATQNVSTVVQGNLGQNLDVSA